MRGAIRFTKASAGILVAAFLAAEQHISLNLPYQYASVSYYRIGHIWCSIDAPGSIAPVLRREYAGRNQSGQALLAGVPGCCLEARRAPGQSRMACPVGTAICTRGARCAASRPHLIRGRLGIRPLACSTSICRVAASNRLVAWLKKMTPTASVPRPGRLMICA
jgi:hypothetical protein